GVGRGYLNSPEQTSAKFIAHPFSDAPGTRLYRTGDWARLNADGPIEFVGRRDQQVKLRGFRVELGEIEAALAGHPAIRECAVIARNDSNEEKRLIAYFVAEGTPSVTELRAFMSGQLPDYVVPSAFVKLDALPLSANGKVDRLALPDPDNARPELAGEYVAPRTVSERRLMEIWGEVLRIKHVGTNDNFFELGGNSLLATLVCSRVRNSLKIEVPPRLLFERPTVALMAEAIGMVAAVTPLAISPCQPAERDGTAPLSFPQQQFWLLDQAEPNSSHYNVRAAIKIAGPLAAAKLQMAFGAVVARHEILRTTFVLKEGSPVQSIASSLPFALDISDLSKLEATQRESEVQRVWGAEAEE